MYNTNNRKKILNHREEVLNNIIIKLNLLKEILKNFNTSMFNEEGKKIKLPYTKSIFPILVKSGIIYIDIIDKYYNFNSKKITFDNLYDYWMDFKESTSEAKAKQYKIQQAKVKLLQEDLKELTNTDLQNAILIVKHFGYKVTKEF